MQTISDRAKKMQASPIRKLIPYAKQAEEVGINVIPLNIGQPDIPTPEPILEAIRSFDNKILAYSQSQGEEALLEAFEKYYHRNNINLKKDEIIVTTSGSEAVYFAFLATCDIGDELLVFEPFYANYNGLATQAGISLKAIQTYPENGFHLPTAEEIEAAITPHTRGILICNPNNPTGTVYTRDELNCLAQVAIKHNLYILSDEVYREFVYDGQQHVSIMQIANIGENAILIDSASKRYSACGARIGLIASQNKSVMQACLKFAQARLCSPTLEQMAVTAGVEMDTSYFKPILEEYQHRRDVIMGGLSKIPGVVCETPGGAFYCIVKLPVKNAEEFAKWLLTDFDDNGDTVLVAPAQGFYSTPGLGLNEVRLSYVIEAPKLARAMEVLGIAIKEYQLIEACCMDIAA